MVKADADITALIAASQTQVMVIGEFVHGSTVVPVRCLIDLAPSKDGQFSNALADFKTTKDASQTNWEWDTENHGYDMQAALELDLWNAATGEKREMFLHPIVENTSPYITGRRFLTSEKIEFGRQKYVKALQRYAECVATGNWPDYDEGGLQVGGWTACGLSKRAQYEVGKV
jgi:hypothetical protein